MKAIIIHSRIKRLNSTLFKQKANEKASCETISCSNSENCELYKRGECSLISTFSWQKCPYGAFNKEDGPTKRSKNFSKWIKDREEQYGAYENKLKEHSSYMSIVGDYIFLPYLFITNCDNVPFLSKGGAFNKENVFLKLSDFNIENIENIVKNKPKALFRGDEIKDYQKEVVPLFLTHLKEKFPLFYEKLELKYPEIKGKKESNIGRLALLNTLKPNTGVFIDIHGRDWTYDGVYLTSINKGSVGFAIINKFEEALVRIKPDSSCKIKVNSEDQVLPTTKFLS